MSLEPGSVLGHYRVLEPLGSGGMGEVYRASDTVLERDVALKVLPEALVADRDRVQRLEREARVLASLHHPNIAVIHSLEEIDGILVLVLEIVEGVTLAACLTRGRMPVEQSLDVACQIAAALEAAHERGVVHRDLKPANVMIDQKGLVKVLDFGLAKEMKTLRAVVGASTSETLDDVGDGRLNGTVPYMSPEQLRGGALDGRSDVWSFGCVLYEMLSGSRAFEGDTLSDTLAEVLRGAPDWRRVPRHTPLLARSLLRRCLRRNPEQRVHDIADARLELEDALSQLRRASDGGAIGTPKSEAPAHSRELLRWGGATALLLTLAVALTWVVASRPGRGPPLLRQAEPLQVTAADAWEAQPALSPDGSRIAFASNVDGDAEIYVIDINGRNRIRITDSPAEDVYPAWYPDGSAIAFASNRAGETGVWKVGQFGGGATLLVPAATQPAIAPDGSAIAFVRLSPESADRIAVAPLPDREEIKVLTGAEDGVWNHGSPAWSPDSKTLCYESRHGLWLVPAAGGEPKRLTSGEALDSEPVWAPDGRTIYFASDRGNTIALWRVSAAGGAPSRVSLGMGPESHPSLSRSGERLVYTTDYPQRQLVLRDRLRGEEIVLTRGSRDVFPAIAPDLSRVVFVSAPWGHKHDLWMLQLEKGRPSDAPFQLLDDAGRASQPVFSPDGKWIAYYRIVGEERDIWTLPAAGGAPLRFTHDAAADYHPAWSPDGARIAFTSERGGARRIWVAPVREGVRAGEARVLTRQQSWAEAPAWSPDGGTVAFVGRDEEGVDVWLVPADGAQAARRVTRQAGAQRVRWDSTADWLLVTGTWEEQGFSLRRVRVEDGRVEELDPPLRFGTTVVATFDVSSDGRFVAFSRGTIRGDIWSLRMGTAVD